MDPQRFSAIAHSTHLFCSPVSIETLSGLLATVPLVVGSRVIDFGCGTGGMALWIADNLGASVDAIERSAPMAELARERLERSETNASVTIHECAADEFTCKEPYDLAIAIGVDRLFGEEIRDTLHGLTQRVGAGKYILFGDTYWRTKPSPSYLHLLGMSEEMMGSFEDLRDAAYSAGLQVLAAHEASASEWAAYEERYSATIDNYLAENPTDPDADAFYKRNSIHRAMYRDYGRDTMGLGLLMLSTPH